LAIPRGSRHPKEAWEFIRWLCADKEGTSTVAKVQGLFPGWRKSPYLEEISKKQGYSQFLEIMRECRHQRPVMPAQAFYMGALDRAIDFAIHDMKTPKQALADARKETQEELDLRLAGR
jgi:maltose-binding protein MalE